MDELTALYTYFLKLFHEKEKMKLMIPNNHTRPHFVFKSVRIMILAFMMFSLLIGFGSGGNSSNNEPDPPEDPITVSGKTVFGLLTGATVRLYEAFDLNVPVYTTTTNTTEDV